jgi:hypothetical protein
MISLVPTSADRRKVQLPLNQDTIVLVSAIVDIATAPAAARAHKRRLNLTPVAVPSAGVGVVGTVTF